MTLLPKAHIGVLATALVATATAAMAQPPTYQLKDLGFSQPYCLGGSTFNQSGQSLLDSIPPGANVGEASYLVEPDGTRTYLGSLFGVAELPVALNDSGQAVGLSATTSQRNVYHAFFWSRASGIVDITPDSSTSVASSVTSLNNHGDVVGTFSGGAYVYTGGRRYNFNTDVNIIGRTPSTTINNAGCINDAGQVLAWGDTGDMEIHTFLLTPISGSGVNLLAKGGFEEYAPPALGTPGWVSDSIRSIPAKSETNQPHSGSDNGACWATTSQDCGMYQEITVPTTGPYKFTVFANADRDGGFVGVNVNGAGAVSLPVAVRGFGNYGIPYNLAFNAIAGDTIRVWMYSPATPGYVVIDDATLAFDPTADGP